MSDQPEGPSAADADGARDREIDLALDESQGRGPGGDGPGATPAAARDVPSGPTAQTSIPPEKAVELLSRINLFSGLQPTYLRRIASLGLEEDYDKDALIFQEG